MLLYLFLKTLIQKNSQETLHCLESWAIQLSIHSYPEHFNTHIHTKIPPFIVRHREFWKGMFEQCSVIYSSLGYISLPKRRISVCVLIMLRTEDCMKLKFSKCIAHDLRMCSVPGEIGWMSCRLTINKNKLRVAIGCYVSTAMIILTTRWNQAVGPSTAICAN